MMEISVLNSRAWSSHLAKPLGYGVGQLASGRSVGANQDIFSTHCSDEIFPGHLKYNREIDDLNQRLVEILKRWSAFVPYRDGVMEWCRGCRETCSALSTE